MSRTVITLKFKLRWFPEDAGYSAEKVYTDINLSPLMSDVWLINFGFKKMRRYVQAKNSDFTYLTLH